VLPSPHSLLPSTILFFHKAASPFSTLLHLTMHLSEVEVHRMVDQSVGAWKTIGASPSSRVAAVVVACEILRLASGALSLATMIEEYLSTPCLRCASRI
jgi:hypothetical protein